jgi:hypothetical protein
MIVRNRDGAPPIELRIGVEADAQKMGNRRKLNAILRLLREVAARTAYEHDEFVT